jgi:hypothetical protein
VRLSYGAYEVKRMQLPTDLGLNRDRVSLEISTLQLLV